MIRVLDADANVVALAFAICSITAPMCGAAIGGYLSDQNVSQINEITNLVGRV
jgi:hypothetical protein